MANKEEDCLKFDRICNPIPKRSAYSTEKEEECRKGSTGHTFCACLIKTASKMEKERGIKKNSVMRNQEVMHAVMRNKELFPSRLKQQKCLTPLKTKQKHLKCFIPPIRNIDLQLWFLPRKNWEQIP